MNEVERAWVAGLLEGEASFVFAGRSKSGRQYPQINCGMTDRDVIEKLHRTVGCGNFRICHSNQRKDSRHKEMYYWWVSRRGDVERVLREIRPLMGQRRRARIDEQLQYFDDNPPVYLEPQCGDQRMYARGCRCQPCRAAEKKYRRDLKQKREHAQAA